MSALIHDVCGVQPPYNLYFSPALSIDIHNAQTPEEAFDFAQTFKKACALHNFFAQLWNSRQKGENASEEKVYICIPSHHNEITLNLNVLNDYVWVNFPFIENEGTTPTNSKYWDMPLTPHAFYCLLRLTIDHITELPKKEFAFEQRLLCAPKLDAFAETLLTKTTECITEDCV